jgi:hypothetical protein
MRSHWALHRPQLRDCSDRSTAATMVSRRRLDDITDQIRDLKSLL